MKIVFLFVLMLTCQGIFGQSMTFEETVRYIEGKIECCTVDYEEQIKYSKVEISKNGNIKFINKAGKTLLINIFDLYKTSDNKTGISSNGDELQFYYESNRYKMIRFNSAPEAQRASKAFNHLLTVCKKESDPFD